MLIMRIWWEKNFCNIGENKWHNGFRDHKLYFKKSLFTDLLSFDNSSEMWSFRDHTLHRLLWFILKVSQRDVAGPCGVQSSSLTPHSFIHAFMRMALFSGGQSSYRKGLSPNCCRQIIQIVLVCWSIKDYFAGTKKPSPNPGEQSHTIIPSASSFTLDTTQPDKCRSPGNCQTLMPSSVCQMERRDLALHSDPVL